MTRRIAVPVTLTVLACSSAGAPTTPAPGAAELVYAMPGANPLTYTVADTTGISMDIAGSSVTIDAAATATLDIAFTSTRDRLKATISYTDLSGQFNNSMGPSLTLGRSDMPGPATLEIDRRGAITMTELPELNERIRQVLGSESGYRRLFVRLPGRAVTRGTEWTDTITITDDNAGITSQTTSVVTSALTGDTTIGGRRLQVIQSRSASTTALAGSTQGFEIRQSLQGSAQAVTLWDPALHALIERRETADMTGTMELPAMNMSGIPVSYRNRQLIQLRPRG